jgi:hypothetical protein
MREFQENDPENSQQHGRVLLYLAECLHVESMHEADVATQPGTHQGAHIKTIDVRYWKECVSDSHVCLQKSHSTRSE